MVHWTYDRVLFEHPDKNVFMLECLTASLLSIKDGIERGGLLASLLWALKQTIYMNRNVNNAGYMIGTWKPGESFKPETEFRLWDWGSNYYAPQSFNDSSRSTCTVG